MTDEEIIDKILSKAKESKSGVIQVEKYLNEIGGKQDDKLLHRIVNRMVAEYIGIDTGGGTLSWLPGGRSIADEGFLKIFKRKQAADEEEARAKKTTIKLNEVNLQLNSFLLKYKWWPYILSIAAIGISIVAIFVSFIKS